MNKKRIGDEGERIAADYLKVAGYKIVKMNFRCRLGEIDIIASKNGELYFVEVKTRRGNSHGSPLESITFYKQRQIIKVAKVFLSGRREEVPCHFSAVGISMGSDGENVVEYLPDAFEIC